MMPQSEFEEIILVAKIQEVSLNSLIAVTL